jgi:putative Mg2+ transporter-C (MgtC) family protein
MEGVAYGWTFDLNHLSRLLLAVILGGTIGLEREFRGRPAGLRTHILVCLGATIMILASEGMSGLYQSFSPGSRITLDPGRIAAGIITGIGFLGAGAIIRIGDLVRGLTTAGCIWFVAGLGIIIGEGLHGLAIFSTGIALMALMLLGRLEHRIQPTVYRSIVMVVALSQAQSAPIECQKILKERRIRIQDISHRLFLRSEEAEITFKIRTRNQLQGGEVLQALASLPGVKEVHWV